jgi:hypothetical protein
MRRVFLTTILVSACASNGPARSASAEPLYFAVEVVKAGKKVGAPKLLGFEGHKVTAERRAPGAAEPDYRLVLEPREAGAGFRLSVELTLPDGSRSRDVALLHGEERSVALGADTELKVMMMRVDSDEFRALVKTPDVPQRGQI